MCSVLSLSCVHCPAVDAVFMLCAHTLPDSLDKQTLVILSLHVIVVIDL